MSYQNNFQQTIFQGAGVFQGGARTILVDENEHIQQRRNTFQTSVFQGNIFQDIPADDVDGYIKTMELVRHSNEIQQVQEPISAFQESAFQNNAFQQVAKKGIIRSLGAVKMITEILNLTDNDSDNAYNISHGFNKFVNETMNIITNKLSYRDRFRQISDTLNFTESVPDAFRGRYRFANENMHIIDFDGRLKLIIRMINEVQQLLEPISAFQNSAFQGNTFQTIARKGIVRAMGFVRMVAPELINISETAPRLGLRIRFENAVVNITTATHKAFGYNRFGNDNISISETTAKPRVMARIRDEVMQIPEQFNKVRTMIRYVNEILNISTIKQAYRDRFRSVSDTVNISEETSKVRGWIFTIVDGAMNIAEGFKRIRIHTIKAGGTRSTKLYNRTRSARLYGRIKSAKLFNRRRSSRGATRT